MRKTTFVMLSCDALASRNLSPAAKVLLAGLDYYAGADATGHPAKSSLQMLTGLCGTTIKLALRELIKEGHLEVIGPRHRRDGGQSSNRYLLSMRPLPAELQTMLADQEKRAQQEDGQ